MEHARELETDEDIIGLNGEKIKVQVHTVKL